MNKSRQERAFEKSLYANESVNYDLVCLIIENILVIRILCKYFESRTFHSFVNLIIRRYPKLEEFKKFSAQNKKIPINIIRYRYKSIYNLCFDRPILQAGNLDYRHSNINSIEMLKFDQRCKTIYMCHGETISYTKDAAMLKTIFLNDKQFLIFDVATVGRVIKLRPLVASLSHKNKKNSGYVYW
jgi:hypothetical protein